MFERLRYRLRLYSYRYMRFIQHFIANIRLISGALGIITMVMAVFCITTLIIFAGFDLQPTQALHLRAFLRVVQGIFIFNIAYNLPAILRPEQSDTIPDELLISDRLNSNVALIKLFPGIGEPILRAMLAAPGLRAVVLETFGAGNAPTSEWFIRLLEETIARGIHVVNITQCGGGSVSMELYETGLRLQKTGVLCGYDMTTEAAVTKLMYLLGKELSAEALRDAMRKSLRGEITV